MVQIARFLPNLRHIWSPNRPVDAVLPHHLKANAVPKRAENVQHHLRVAVSTLPIKTCAKFVFYVFPKTSRRAPGACSVFRTRAEAHRANMIFHKGLWRRTGPMTAFTNPNMELLSLKIIRQVLQSAARGGFLSALDELSGRLAQSAEGFRREAVTMEDFHLQLGVSCRAG